MSARLLDGKTLATRRRSRLAERVARLADDGVYPHLAVIVPTQDDAALAYFRAKQRLGEQLGISVQDLVLDRPSTADLSSAVDALASDRTVSGIMIEAPWPEDVDSDAIRSSLPGAKDVDGAGTASMGHLLAGLPTFPPATAAAVVAMLDDSHVELEGARVAVVGRSLVVGRPLALLLLQRHATVTVCHSRTKDLAEITRRADIVCVAVGRPGLLTSEMVGPQSVVIDVGTNVVDGRLVGDVAFDDVSRVAAALSPVPGGVGPLTTTILMEHVVRAAEEQNGRG